MVEKIRHLGERSGTLLVFGGVYSNYEALEALIAYAVKCQIPRQNIICTGDIVGYCANPEAVVQRIKNWGIHCIAGNVEIQLRAHQAHCGCNFSNGSTCDVLAKQWYPYSQEKLSEEAIAWMTNLPEFISFNYANKKFFVLHGAYRHTSEFIFKSTPWAAKHQNFIDTQSDVILAGHCGLPFHHAHGDHLWINPGAIGMPANDGQTSVWYSTLNDDNNKLKFNHLNLNYNHDCTASKIVKNALPRQYALTLQTGIWDNCDILPDTETNQQGQPIVF